MSSLTEAWTEELASTGRVHFTSRYKQTSRIAGIVGYAFVVGILVLWYVYNPFSTSLLIGIVAILAVVIVALVIFTGRNGDGYLLIDTTALHTRDGKLIPWRDIIGAERSRQYRLEGTIRIHLTEDGWRDFMARETASGRASLRAENSIGKSRYFYLAQYTDAPIDELAAWLNSLAQGKQ